MLEVVSALQYDVHWDRPALRWNLSSPQGESSSVNEGHFVADGGNMVDQPQVFNREVLRRRSRVYVQAREGKHPGALPLLYSCLDLGRPHEVGPVGGGGSILCHGNVIVGTFDLVLGTVAALREALVTSDMSTLARGRMLVEVRQRDTQWKGLPCVTAFARLRVARGWSVLKVSLTVQGSRRERTDLRRGGPPPGPAIAQDFN